jgi:hypothetical protein
LSRIRFLKLELQLKSCIIPLQHLGTLNAVFLLFFCTHSFGLSSRVCVWLAALNSGCALEDSQGTKHKKGGDQQSQEPVRGYSFALSKGVVFAKTFALGTANSVVVDFVS